jgi:hexosaminidase
MDFQTVAHVEYPIEGKNDPDGIKEYTVTFPETDSKYLHVTARTLEALPQWHGAKGRKGYLFVDEVIVK